MTTFLTLVACATFVLVPNWVTWKECQRIHEMWEESVQARCRSLEPTEALRKQIKELGEVPRC